MSLGPIGDALRVAQTNVGGFTNLLLCATEDDDATVRYVAPLAVSQTAVYPPSTR